MGGPAGRHPDRPLPDVRWVPEEGVTEVLYLFDPAHHGHGYATEAARAALAHRLRHAGAGPHRRLGDARQSPRRLAVMERIGMARQPGTVHRIRGRGASSTEMTQRPMGTHEMEANAMTRDAAIAAATDYLTSGAFEEDLARRVAIPTESQTPEGLPHTRRYLELEMIPGLRGDGVQLDDLREPPPRRSALCCWRPGTRGRRRPC